MVGFLTGPVLAAEGPIQPAPPYAAEESSPDVVAQYQASQFDPELDSEARIRFAVDTYFTLLLEGIVKRCPFDFGFLVDLTSASGQDLYRYEIGRLEYSLAWWEECGVSYADYEYLPSYQQVHVDSSVANVTVLVKTTLRYQSSSTFTISVQHDLTLVQTTDGWKLVADVYEDPFRKGYPPGTDFSARMPGVGGDEEVPAEVVPEPPPSPNDSRLGIAAWGSAVLAVLALTALLVRKARTRERRR